MIEDVREGWLALSTCPFWRTRPRWLVNLSMACTGKPFVFLIINRSTSFLWDIKWLKIESFLMPGKGRMISSLPPSGSAKEKTPGRQLTQQEEFTGLSGIPYRFSFYLKILDRQVLCKHNGKEVWDSSPVLEVSMIGDGCPGRLAYSLPDPVMWLVWLFWKTDH